MTRSHKWGETMGHPNKKSIAGMALVCGAALAFVGAGTLIQAQEHADHPALPEGAMTALTSPVDAVIGRRLLMISIGANNDAVHDMLDEVTEWDPDELYSRLTSMAMMLYAFPSLYRAAPDPWTPEGEAADPARVSLATEAVWQSWDSFYEMSMEASRVARWAADAPFEDTLELVEELEVLCDSCHEVFRREFTYLDYDDLESARRN